MPPKGADEGFAPPLFDIVNIFSGQFPEPLEFVGLRFYQSLHKHHANCREPLYLKSEVHKYQENLDMLFFFHLSPCHPAYSAGIHPARQPTMHLHSKNPRCTDQTRIVCGIVSDICAGTGTTAYFPPLWHSIADYVIMWSFSRSFSHYHPSLLRNPLIRHGFAVPPSPQGEGF